MPDIMEISGLVGGRMPTLGRGPGIADLRAALGKMRRKTKKAKVKKVRRHHRKSVSAHKVLKVGVRPVGPSAERMLEIAEMMYAKGNKPLALAWAARALKRAKAENKLAVVQRVTELIMTIRGEAVLKTAAGLNDIQMIYMGAKLGLW